MSKSVKMFPSGSRLLISVPSNKGGMTRQRCIHVIKNPPVRHRPQKPRTSSVLPGIGITLSKCSQCLRPSGFVSTTTRSRRAKSTSSKNNNNNNSSSSTEAASENTPTSSTANSNHANAITRADLQKLQNEVKALKELVQQQQKSQTDRVVEAMTQTLSNKTTSLEATLKDINQHVSRISVVEKIVTGVQDLLQNHPAVQNVLQKFEALVEQSTPFVKHYKYGILATLMIVGILWKYRSSLVYERTSEEVADLARLTLEQDSLRLSIQETLYTVANNPSTLQTLNELVQKLVRDEETQQELVTLVVHAVQTQDVQNALLELLQVVFEDEHLQQLTGEFLLKGLNMENVKRMLDEQTAELVRDTVSDDSVQQATAVGIQRSLWYAVTPSFLWRFMENKSKSHNESEESEKQNNNVDHRHKVTEIWVPSVKNDDDQEEEEKEEDDDDDDDNQGN